MGVPENAVTRSELREKFLTLASPIIGRERAIKAHDVIWDVAGLPSVAPIAACVAL